MMCEGTTPSDVVDENFEREGAQTALSNADAPASPLLHSQALTSCVTRAFLKQFLISTALLELHEIPCPSTAADGF